MIFKQKALKFEGNWLLTGPNELPMLDYGTCSMPTVSLHSNDEINPINFRPQRKYGSNNGTQRETLGTVETHTYTSSTMDSTRQRNTDSLHHVSQPFFVSAQDDFHMPEEEEENEDEEQI